MGQVEAARTELTAERAIAAAAQAWTPQLSPDGERMVFGLARIEPGLQAQSSQLRIAARDGTDASAFAPEIENPVEFRWSPDGRSVAVVAAETTGWVLWVCGTDGRDDPRRITSHPDLIQQITWAADSDRLAYSVPVGAAELAAASGTQAPTRGSEGTLGTDRVRVITRRDYRFDGFGFVDDALTQVFVVEIPGGQRRLVTTWGGHDHSAPGFSPDGRYLAMLAGSQHLEALELLVVDLTAESADGLVAHRVELGFGLVTAWAWAPDSTRLAIAADPDERDQPGLYLYVLDQARLHSVIADPDFLLTSGDEALVANGLVWLDDHRVLCHGVRKCASGLYEVDVDRRTLEQRSRWDAQHGAFSFDARRHYAVSAFTSFGVVSAIAVHDLQDAQPDVVVDFGKELVRACPPAEWERSEVPGPAGPIEVFVLRPPGFTPEGRYPLVIDIHGGPQWYFGYQYWPWQQLLASHGFVVAVPNVRGSASYGSEWAHLVRGDWGPGPYQDLICVLDSLLERPYLDEGRVGLHGYSYGGFLVNYAIGQDERFRAAVSGGSITDLRSYAGTGDLAFGSTMRRQLGGSPFEAAELYRRSSPSEYLHGATTPTLILHGEADLRCPVSQAEQLFSALLDAGCETVLVRYPGADHNLPFAGAPDQRADYSERLLGWMRQHVAGD